MSIIIDQFTVIWLILVVFSFIIGYFYGRSKIDIGGVLYTTDDQQLKYNSKIIQNNLAQQKPLIKIDETKFVTEIDTTSMEKKFDSLGDTQTSSEDFGQSINKLKNMKR